MSQCERTTIRTMYVPSRVTVAIQCFTENPPDDDEVASEYVANLIIANKDALSLEVSSVEMRKLYSQGSIMATD